MGYYKRAAVLALEGRRLNSERYHMAKRNHGKKRAKTGGVLPASALQKQQEIAGIKKFMERLKTVKAPESQPWVKSMRAHYRKRLDALKSSL